MQPPGKPAISLSPRRPRRLARARRYWLLALLPLLLCLLSPPPLARNTAALAPARPPTPAPSATASALPSATATRTALPSATATRTALPSATPSTLVLASPTLSPTISRTIAPLPTRPAPRLYPTAHALPAAAPRIAAAPVVTMTTTPAVPTAVPGSIHALPILMYHYVREVDAYSDPLGYKLSIAPAAFAAQLDWLQQQGYTPVRMDTALRCLQGQPGCPARPVALTFDDGYADAGMEIGAHSRNHLDLTTLPPAQAYAEIADSQRQLAERLSVPVTSFCYPAGKFSYATRAQVADIGFTNATTTLQGWDYSNAYLLPRLRIEGGSDLQGFAWLVQAHTP
jgi:hypothetical protein